MMKLTPGSRWRSAVCDTEVVVVKPPKESGELQCGGVAMIPSSTDRPEGLSPVEAFSGGTLLGKRYNDDVAPVGVLCIKAGKGSLAFDGRALVIPEVKRLPSSD